MERTADEARGDPDRRPPDRGADHARHAPGRRGARTSRRTTSASTSSASSTRWAGPQQLLPQLTQFQPADTPERLEAFIARLHAYPGVHGREHRRSSATGCASGLTAPRIVDRADDRPDRADAGRPDRGGDRPRRWSKVASDADRERDPRVVRDVVYPADRPSSRRLRGEYLAATPRGAGHLVRARRRRALPDRDPGWTTLDLDPDEVHQIGLDELEQIEAERREIAQAAGFGDDTAAYRAALDADPANTPATKAELVARAAEDIERAMAARAAVLRRPAQAPAARSARSRSTRRRTRRSRTTTRRRPTARARASTTSTPTTCRAASTRSSRRRRTTRRHPGTTSRSRLEMENPDLNAFRRLGARIVGGAYVEGWGLYSERLADEMGLFRNEAERFGMLDAQAWRAARLVVDTGLHALRWARQRSIDFLLSDRAVRDRRGHRDRPLHLLAGPGADLQGRPARDRAAAPRARGARRLGVRPAGVPRRGPRPRLAAARDAGARAPDLGGHPGLTAARPLRSRSRSPSASSVRRSRPAPALVAVGAVELVAHQVRPRRAERLGRERDRRARDDAQPQAVLVGSQDEVAHDARRPAARADAQARVAERVRHPPAHRLRRT